MRSAFLGIFYSQLLRLTSTQSLHVAPPVPPNRLLHVHDQPSLKPCFSYIVELGSDAQITAQVWSSDPLMEEGFHRDTYHPPEISSQATSSRRTGSSSAKHANSNPLQMFHARSDAIPAL